MFNKFIHRPVLSIVISLIIVFLGVLALIQLPVTQFPSVSPPKVNVTVEYPGANNELLIKSAIIPLWFIVLHMQHGFSWIVYTLFLFFYRFTCN